MQKGEVAQLQDIKPQDASEGFSPFWLLFLVLFLHKVLLLYTGCAAIPVQSRLGGEQGLSLVAGPGETPARCCVRMAGDILGCNPEKVTPGDEKIQQAVGGRLEMTLMGFCL